jgi:hypothetical protein
MIENKCCAALLKGEAEGRNMMTSLGNGIMMVGQLVIGR